MTVRAIPKPTGLSVTCVAPARDGVFVAGYIETDPTKESPYKLYLVQRGFAHDLGEVPFPIALVADGAGGALLGTHGGLWACTTSGVRCIDERMVSVVVCNEHHAYWASAGDVLRVPLAGGPVEVIERSRARITALAHHRDTLYWIAADKPIPPPEILPGGFAVLGLDDAPRTLVTRAADGGVHRMPLVKLMITEILVDDRGVMALTRGGAPEQFDGRVLHAAPGAATWNVVASGRKLPTLLTAIAGGAAWSYRLEIGYVIEASVGGRVVTLLERPNAQLNDLVADGGELLIAEQRLERLRSGATLVTSEHSLLAMRL